jgi:multidrug efflux system membrane fusion protein
MDAEVKYLLDQQAIDAKSRSRRKLIVGTIASLLIAAAGGWYFLHHNAVPDQSQSSNGSARNRRFGATVGTAIAAQQSIPVTLDALGTVTPLATAIVRAQVSGVLRQVLYTEGQMVKRGQPLVLIDPVPFQLALDQSRGNLQRDMAQLDVAKVMLARNQALLAQDSIAQQEVDTQAATVKQFAGVVATDQANVDTARLNLGYCRVVAPIDGRVGFRTVDVGNYVSVGDVSGVATITQLAPIDVIFALPSDAIVRIQTRIASGDALTATVMDRTKANILEQGSFLTLDNQVDVQTGTVRAKARFTNAQQSLFPNQFVNVRLLIDTLKNAIVVPAAAVRHGPQGDFAYVVTPESTARIQAITTGPATADLISIASGLAIGDQVITEGGDRLTDGATVTLAEPRRDRPSSSDANSAAKTNPSGKKERRDPSKRRSGNSTQ